MHSINIPQCVAGYNVGVKIGSGSYATIFKGFSAAPDQKGVRETIAIKCIDRRNTIANRISSDNVVREITILKRLNHRHIVRLLDFQWDKRNIYLIMEFCGGGDLSSFIRLHRKLPEEITRKFFRQLASAIHYLRSFDIAHMDLKPQNILLTSRHRPVLKLADFGLSQHLREGVDWCSSLRGSLLYIAPEIFTKVGYDARVDLWSCGVILYECLYGTAPFASSSQEQLIKQITSHESIKLPHSSSLSEQCVDLLKGLLVRNPSHRISFDDFFAHSFVDLAHAPSDLSLEKANDLVISADLAAKNGNRVATVKLMVEAIELYLSILQVLEDEIQREQIRDTVHRCMHRAECLKKELRPVEKYGQGVMPLGADEDLCRFWNDTPQVRASLLVVVKAAELELQEKWTDSLDKYQLAVDTMLQLVAREPPGRRKDMLSRRIASWLSKAEQIRQYIDVVEMNLSTVVEKEQAEIAIENDTQILAEQHQCVVQ